MNRKPKQEGPRTNEAILVEEIRLIDENGEMIGVIKLDKALEKAKAAGLDLVEVSPNAQPPVCKILDYGKYKYQEQKRKAEAKKKQKTVELKEIKLRPGIEDHDFNTKMRAVRKFLNAGDKVKISMRFRGREVVHQDIAMRVFDRVQEEFDETIAKVDQPPKMEGRQMIMLLSSTV